MKLRAPTRKGLLEFIIVVVVAFTLMFSLNAKTNARQDILSSLEDEPEPQQVQYSDCDGESWDGLAFDEATVQSMDYNY